jgi:hypothetical protein
MLHCADRMSTQGENVTSGSIGGHHNVRLGWCGMGNFSLYHIEPSVIVLISVNVFIMAIIVNGVLLPILITLLSSSSEPGLAWHSMDIGCYCDSGTVPVHLHVVPHRY